VRIIGGKWRGRKIESPPEKDMRIRPTSDRVRENLFNILLSRFDGNLSEVRVADMCAGTGALGLEALSRGAKSCIFVEKEKAARVIIERNIKLLDTQPQATIFAADVTRLPAATHPADLLFFDPPYGAEFVVQVMEHLIAQGWCSDEALLCLEQPAGAELAAKGWLIDDCRTYGKTSLYFFKHEV
jgi:16S rRNA (guanine966-N2)-methyltransferase